MRSERRRAARSHLSEQLAGLAPSAPTSTRGEKDTEGIRGGRNARLLHPRPHLQRLLQRVDSRRATASPVSTHRWGWPLCGAVRVCWLRGHGQQRGGEDALQPHGVVRRDETGRSAAHAVSTQRAAAGSGGLCAPTVPPFLCAAVLLGGSGLGACGSAGYARWGRSRRAAVEDTQGCRGIGGAGGSLHRACPAIPIRFEPSALHSIDQAKRRSHVAAQRRQLDGGVVRVSRRREPAQLHLVEQGQGRYPRGRCGWRRDGRGARGGRGGVWR
mmetsp:Transcript_3982/g.13161  ORF Transcript_3982/g.13161 Transcript_3982/m.13161 type:complete len:271 (+) Transcript_3982:544-1356(+)